MNNQIKVLEKGRIVLPKAMCEKYGIKQGDKATFTDLGNCISARFHHRSRLSGLYYPV